MRIIRAKITWPNGQITQYEGHIHHDAMPFPEDRHIVSGYIPEDEKDLWTDRYLKNTMMGAIDVRATLKRVAIVHPTAIVEITEDDGDLLHYPDLPPGVRI